MLVAVQILLLPEDEVSWWCVCVSGKMVFGFTNLTNSCEFHGKILPGALCNAEYIMCVAVQWGSVKLNWAVAQFCKANFTAVP